MCSQDLYATTTSFKPLSAISSSRERVTLTFLPLTHSFFFYAVFLLHEGQTQQPYSVALQRGHATCHSKEWAAWAQAESHVTSVGSHRNPQVPRLYTSCPGEKKVTANTTLNVQLAGHTATLAGASVSAPECVKSPELEVYKHVQCTCIVQSTWSKCAVCITVLLFHSCSRISRTSWQVQILVYFSINYSVNMQSTIITYALISYIYLLPVYSGLKTGTRCI